MTSGNPAEAVTGAAAEISDLQAELDGAREELLIVREELLAACINEATALSSVNHLTHYLGQLHDRWSDPADPRSLEDVVDQAMNGAKAALDEAHRLSQRLVALDAVEQRLRDIEGSRLYRTAGVYRRAIERLLPTGTRRRAVYRRLL